MATFPWTAIVPTFGEKGIALTKQCVDSLWQYHYPYHGRVIVVDDGSDPAVAAELGEQLKVHQNTMVIRSHENRGFAHTCNIGIQHAASGTIVVLVNNDIEFVSPALAQVADFVGKNNGICGIRLLYPDSTIQHGGVVYVPQGAHGYFDHAFRNAPAHIPDANVIGHRLVTGAFFAIHPQCFWVSGLLDERYGMAVEDIDFCLEAIISGLPVWYNGYVHAIHHEGQTRGKTVEEKRAFPKQAQAESEGLAKFFDKWQGLDLGVFQMDDYLAAMQGRR